MFFLRRRRILVCFLLALSLVLASATLYRYMLIYGGLYDITSRGGNVVVHAGYSQWSAERNNSWTKLYGTEDISFSLIAGLLAQHLHVVEIYIGDPALDDPDISFDDKDFQSLISRLNLNHLEAINLGGTAITDATVELLPRNELRWTQISATDILDRSLDTFAKFPKLEQIDCEETRISDEARERFRMARPDIYVHHLVWGTWRRRAQPGWSFEKEFARAVFVPLPP